MASARGIRLDETEVLALALLKTEQLSAICQENIKLLRTLLHVHKGSPSAPSRRPVPEKGRSPKHVRERTEQEETEEEDEAGPSLNAKGPLLYLDTNSAESSLTLDDIDDEGRYDVNQVAAVLGKSAYTIRSWVKTGKIDAEREGKGKGRFLLTGSEIRRHAESSSN